VGAVQNAKGSAVKLYDVPVIDEYGTVTVAEYGGWLVQIMPMIFNDRVVLTPVANPMLIDYGWCFRKGGAAFLAVKAWDPDEEAEPAGHIKAVIPGRRAGQHA
jgi:hypothetical protein